MAGALRQPQRSALDIGTPNLSAVMKSIIFLLLLALVLASQADVEIGEDTWESTLASNQQTFVKFYSPYCGM